MSTEDRDFARVDQKLRDAFPSDAGLSAEKTRALYERLKPPVVPRSRLTRASALRLATIGSLVVLFVAAALFATVRPSSVPPHPGSTAEKVRATASRMLPVPQMALAAISEVTDVVHYVSTADQNFGYLQGHSSEEMWLDEKAQTGRLVKRYYRGGAVVATVTTVADGASAVIITEEPGRAPRSAGAGAGGTWRKEFDKLSTYRNMLESGEVTVTGQGSVQGVQTHKLAASIPDFPTAGINAEMHAEIRAADYLPVSFTYAYRRASDGAVLGTGSRTFTLFEHVRRTDLPADIFRAVLIAEPATDTPVPPSP